ncbi:unnamed protein product [Acanthoscelides obtectus]|uniref:Cathepsin propeptide inhibitor domain-containing protein n=1 Tax=Acanthoscelides obtectus TaxID=200917 RepID=A0A9P0P802_ACAOB|nr:unnamed protein product [Acanthoscelides obtectus]CAK1657600.1 hypothetical protein AOBTE_LOCUS20441 [Acanthoscelides obtectus]
MFSKSVVILLSLVVVTMAALTAEEQWTNFKATHGKKYDSPEEEQRRFKIFQNTLKTIEEHNKKYEAGEVTWQMGINQFADVTEEEMKKFHTGLLLPKDENSN